MAYKDTDCGGNGMNGCSPACAVVDMIMGDDSSNNLIFTTADGKAHILDLSPLLKWYKDSGRLLNDISDILKDPENVKKIIDGDTIKVNDNGQLYVPADIRLVNSSGKIVLGRIINP